MLCRVVFYHAVQCRAVVWCGVVCDAVPCHAFVSCAVIFCAMLCLCSATPCNVGADLKCAVYSSAMPSPAMMLCCLCNLVVAVK